MTIEEQLLEATKVEPKKFKTRQKLLDKIARVAVKLPDPIWEKLPDPVMTWVEEAAKAIKAKKDVPEFPDAEAEEPPRDPDEELDPSDDEIEPEPEGDDDEGDTEETEEAGEPEDAGEDGQPDEGNEGFDHEAAEAAEAAGDQVEPDAEGDGSGNGTEVTEAEPDEPVPAKKKAKKVKAKEAKPKKAKAKKEPIEPSDAPRYANLSGRKNRYGTYEGTKQADVIAMLEKGATMAEIKAAVGDSKYNLLRKLKGEGHKIDKDGHRFTLTHRDDIAKGKKKK